MYISRTLQLQVEKISSFFPVALVTGPRQVGKTTMLKNCMEKNRTFVSLDESGENGMFCLTKNSLPINNNVFSMNVQDL